MPEQKGVYPSIYIEETEEKTPFEITDIASLTWVMRKILTPAKEKINQTKQLEEAEIDRIKLWAENENRSPLQAIEVWEAKISDFHLELLRNDPEQKTLSTPYGKSSSRTSKAQADKSDDEKLLKYAKDNKLTDLIKVEETVRWGDLKKIVTVVGNVVVDENGEIVPGLKVKPETITTKVELS